jgi:hypothetical protein
MGWGTLSRVRYGWAVTIGVSLALHAAVGVALRYPGHGGKKTEVPVDPAPALAGETFELPAPPTTDDAPLANASPSPDTNAAPAPIDVGDAPARPKPPPQAKPSTRPSHQGRPSGGHTASTDDGQTGGTGGSALYGAVGDRSAVGLGMAFTRAFSQVASADPTWVNAPFGGAGEATVTITLDDSGHIESHSVTGTPSAALASSVRRIIALIKGRPFVAKGKVTRLVVGAKVSAGTPGGDPTSILEIGVTPIEGNTGGAWFVLGIGRRVDMTLRLP